MSQVQRICPHCADATPLDAQYCPHCGYDTQAGLPMRQSNLPVALGKAALPVLAGAATLALRAGWKLLNSRLTQPPTLRQAQPPAIKSETRVSEVVPRSRRTVRIRSSWMVGDANGVWKQGTSEHIIDFDE